jgi:hypothetical protein
MKAELLLRERLILEASTFVEIVIWRVPEPVRGSAHDFKYRLALVAQGNCVLRYDNEAGKGDHKHIDEGQVPYRFRGTEALIEDFWQDVDEWRQTR